MSDVKQVSISARINTSCDTAGRRGHLVKIVEIDDNKKRYRVREADGFEYNEPFDHVTQNA